MREINLSPNPSEILEPTDPEPHPITTDDDLLKIVERAQTLWAVFADAQMRRSEEEVIAAMSDLQGSYIELAKLLDNVDSSIDSSILELAIDEMSYDAVLEKMQQRSRKVNRKLPPANLGNMDYFVL